MADNYARELKEAENNKKKKNNGSGAAGAP